MKNIEISKLSKSFGDNKVLNRLDLSLPRGEISCIMGESGCGKSTLAKILMGINNEKKNNKAPVIIAPIMLVAANVIAKRIIDVSIVPNIPANRSVKGASSHLDLPQHFVIADTMSIIAR